MNARKQWSNVTEFRMNRTVAMRLYPGKFVREPGQKERNSQSHQDSENITLTQFFENIS